MFCWPGGLTAALAQPGWPPVYVFSSDSAFVTLDSTHYQLLEDPTGSLTLAQVQRSSAFRYDAPYNPDRRSHVCWLRMRIRNRLQHDLNMYLCDFNSGYTDLYWSGSGNRWQHQRTGYLLPASQLPGHAGHKERNRLFFRLKPNQEVFLYQRSENAFWEQPLRYLVPQFQPEENLVNEVFNDIRVEKGWTKYWLNGIVLGALLLAVGFNLLIFFSIREKVYLYFSLCLLFFLLDRNTTRIQQALFAEYPYPFHLVANAFFLLFFVFFVYSIRRLVGSASALPRLHKVTSIALGVLVLVNLFLFVGYQYPASPLLELVILVEIMIRVVYLLCLLITYRMMKRGIGDARYMFIAITPLFIWWLFTQTRGLLYTYGGVDLYKITGLTADYAESICLAWMIIFFSATLINRYNLTRRQLAQQAIEKEQLAKEREIERSRIIASQNERLEQQVRERTAELQQSLETLRATQDQLVQKEKLASLGELTAGIAHEIQNPLNFVNNFAEVSTELLDELREEREKEQPDETLANELLADLIQNVTIISHHGRRAGAIVRSMLEHSRTSTGEKQPTDLNALADEYLRLAYHGMRRSGVPDKDKSGPTSTPEWEQVNCLLTTDFDPALPPMTIVPQDIGRVLLNLYSNAFYAVQQKSTQQTNSAAQAIGDQEPYQPAVRVSTRLEDNWVEIYIQDNGPGIPDAIRQKIFQPFFTTKPAGEGTGLGLSLSYDIIAKGHGGELLVKSQPDHGAEFIIRLPVS